MKKNTLLSFRPTWRNPFHCSNDSVLYTSNSGSGPGIFQPNFSIDWVPLFRGM